MYTSGICKWSGMLAYTTKTFYVPSLGMKIIKSSTTWFTTQQHMCINPCADVVCIHTVHQLEGNTHRHSSLAPELGGQDQSLVIDRGRDPQDGGVRLTHAVVTVGL